MKDRESIEKSVKRGQMITKQELAKLYQVSWATIRNWIRINPALATYEGTFATRENYLSPAQYRFLFQHLGEPYETEI
jgi:transposase